MAHVDGSGWVMVPPDVLPRTWQRRAAIVALVPLLPAEAARVLSEGSATPQLAPELATVASDVAQGRTTAAIAKREGLSLRAVQYRLAKLRDAFGVRTQAELVAELARRGFGAKSTAELAATLSRRGFGSEVADK